MRLIVAVFLLMIGIGRLVVRLVLILFVRVVLGCVCCDSGFHSLMLLRESTNECECERMHENADNRKKRGLLFYFRFLYSLNPSISFTYSYPLSISLIASAMVFTALHV